MAWATCINPVERTFSALGQLDGDVFSVNDDCLATLEEILCMLVAEDVTARSFRRAVGVEQNIKKYLIPLLCNVNANRRLSDSSKIIDTTIKILVNLTIPVEYLLSIEMMSHTDPSKHTIFELNNLLISSKEAFTDSRSTRAVVDHMKRIVENDSQLNHDQCDSINNCLLLLRNILHIPETKTTISNCPVVYTSMQNQIIWNLITQSIDKIIIYLMSCPQKMYWCVTLVQLIAMMYKDQHVGTLQKLLNFWLEASFSESSDDNESNTTPPGQASGESSPIVTSDPTSDSSDTGSSERNNKDEFLTNNITSERKQSSEMIRNTQNRSKSLSGLKRNKSTETENSTSSGISSMSLNSENNNCEGSRHNPDAQNQSSSNNMKRECPSSQSETSDYGYATQVENQESISTSSNDDDQPRQKPIHKPHNFQKSKCRVTTALEKKELRRKKLVKRSKSNIIKIKGLLHHLPTDEDIANILKEFTVNFLLKGYGPLVRDLHIQMLTNIHIRIDTSHFFWLMTYFLKFATQLELDLKHINPVLSYEIFSYLVFQGVWIYEELEMTLRIPDVDIKPCLRRLHLVVTAIREFIQAIDSYKKMVHLSDDDRNVLLQLQKEISETKEIKLLFLLLLRQYNPATQNKQYLQDLILTNHNYLLFLDNMSQMQNNHDGIIEHLKQFATVDIMKQYGVLLEDFEENGEFVNNCIFTMMHHTAGDLRNIPTLFQPSILKTFSQIWETDYELCDDWSDLIEYVIHKFINSPRTSHCPDVENITMGHKDPIGNPNVEHGYQIERDSCSQAQNSLTNDEEANQTLVDSNEDTTKKYKHITSRTQLSIIKELLEQNIITEDEYNNFTKSKMESNGEKDENAEEETCNEDINWEHEEVADGDVRVLKEYLFKENKGKFIMWLQNILLEACYVKLALANFKDFQEHRMEPSIYYFALLNLPIPIIPWTTGEMMILKHQPFVLLLHKLGFYIPVDTGKIFVRIPNFWTVHHLFSVAQKLGPIDVDKLKFDISTLGDKEDNTCCAAFLSTVAIYHNDRFNVSGMKEIPSSIRCTPLPTCTEWYKNIFQVKLLPAMESPLKMASSNHLSINIPTNAMIPLNLHPLDLRISETNESIATEMDCSSSLLANDETERNSICDTCSVASDLTRMYVSDEEDKLLVVVKDVNKIN